MGMLARYQKSGGFTQLLQLIETCGKAKQDNFLQIIEKEDPRWSAAIRAKMLTLKKILSWQNTTLAEVAARLHQLTLATALHGLKPEDGERLLQTFTHSQKRNIEDLRKSKAPTNAEISAAYLKVLVEVRSMITQGRIRLETVDPELIIPKDIEDELSKTLLQKSSEPTDFQIHYETDPPPHKEKSAPQSSTQSSVQPSVQNHNNPEANMVEFKTLKAKVQALTNENGQLKAELKALHEKIMNIKKIA